MSQFHQHYAELDDDELIDLALTRELIPEAAEALQFELQKRGIKDLERHRAIREREAFAAEQQRQAQLSHRKKVIGWRTKFLYVASALSCLYGTYRLAIPNIEHPGDDGGLMLVLGIAIFLFALITSRLSKFWGEHVLHRPPSP